MIRHFLLILLSLSLTGACAQKISYRSFKHYNEMVDSFALLTPPSCDDIVMLGDSHTEFGGDWNIYFEGVGSIRNYGIAGDDAGGILHRLSQVCTSSPKAIFFECGINDLSHGLTPLRVASDVIETIDSIRARCPQTPVYVQSLFPINMDVRQWKTLDGKTDVVPEVNALLEAGCRQRGIIYIDVFSVLKEKHSNKLRRELCRDGLHLTRAGYHLWVQAISPYIYALNRRKK